MLRMILRALGGEAFGSELLPRRLLLKHFVIQKILRVNGHVPWPVHWTSTIKDVHKITKGTRFPGLSSGCHIDGRNGIVLGGNVWIGPRVTIISMNHDVTDFNKYVTCDPVIIGKNSWLGTNAIILPSVVLGEHTIVAAGAVVTKSFVEGNQLLAGCPARVAKKLGKYCDA